MLPTVSEVAAGAREVSHAGAAWGPLACAHHIGQAVVALERRTDPATGQPRQERVWDAAAGEWVQREVEFPIYSDDVGYEPGCEDCHAAVVALRLHATAVDADREQADFEFERELRRRGLAL